MNSSEIVINHQNLTLRADMTRCRWRVSLGEEEWRFNDCSRIIMRNGDEIYFRDAMCSSKEFTTGVDHGIRAVYTEMKAQNGTPYHDLSVYTAITFDSTAGTLKCRMRVTGDKNDQVATVVFPGAIEYDAQKGEGYTALPIMQGMLFFAGAPIEMSNGFLYSRDWYMPMFLQTRRGGGYMAIVETPYDGQIQPQGGTRGDWMQPMWRPSQGTVRYPRQILYRFFAPEENVTYVTAAKEYRKYVKQHGTFVTLKEKFTANPNAAYMRGAPIIHFGITTNCKPECRFWPEGKPRHICVPFAERAAQLRALHEKGLKKAYIHTDGWGVAGYDNQHPDYFPVNEEAGGAQGMKELSDTCRALGYRFGIHDQYRDYYTDAATFSPDSAILSPDNRTPHECTWEGGEQAYLCTALAPDYVRRNFAEFDRLGIQIDGAYLDVFSIVDLDECVHPDHPITREQCAAYRRQCIRYLNQRGIISSSEEACDFLVPELITCHWAPYCAVGMEEFDKKVPIPLFNLVYHDCMSLPWASYAWMSGGTEPQHSQEWTDLHALLNGGTCYVTIDADREQIERCQPILALHEKICDQEMLTHEFLTDDCTVQRTVFANGTTVTVDYARQTWEIREGN